MPFKHVGDEACLRAAETSVARDDMVLSMSSHLSGNEMLRFQVDAAKMMCDIYRG